MIKIGKNQIYDCPDGVSDNSFVSISTIAGTYVVRALDFRKIKADPNLTLREAYRIIGYRGEDAQVGSISRDIMFKLRMHIAGITEFSLPDNGTRSLESKTSN
ncbi:hypothetical protein HY212_05520 [Candidatus Pacearchaeota archaeon]|nr:hypothetical protein [Candidatus Pacearchaeota archaeon]